MHHNLIFTKNEDGCAQVAIVVKDFEITNPLISECGRFEVDPVETYGISLVLATALAHLNETLVAEGMAVSPMKSELGLLPAEAAKGNAAQRRYASHEFSKCPMCGCADPQGGSIEVDAQTATQEVTCPECGAAWNDLYRLVGFEVVEEGNSHLAAVGRLREKLETIDKAAVSLQEAIESLGAQPEMEAALGTLNAKRMGVQDELVALGEALPGNARYATAIIGDAPQIYDAIEIRGVRVVGRDPSTGKTELEVDDVNPVFWSVYLHRKEGGVECVGDFATRPLADAYAHELSQTYGYRIV